MKEFIRQFYNEGLATTFIKKPSNFIKRKVKNKKLANALIVLLKIVYTVLVLLFAILMFKKQYPF